MLEVGRPELSQLLARLFYEVRHGVVVAAECKVDRVQLDLSMEAQVGALGHVQELLEVLVDCLLPHASEDARACILAKAKIVGVNFDRYLSFGLLELVVLLVP